GGYQVELAGRFFVKERTLFRVSTAPVLVPTRDPDEVARPDPLLSSIVFVKICALENRDPDIVCVGVHPRVESRHELGKRAVGPLVTVPPEDRRGNARNPFLEGCLVSGDEDQCFRGGPLLLTLRKSDRACNG